MLDSQIGPGASEAQSPNSGDRKIEWMLIFQQTLRQTDPYRGRSPCFPSPWCMQVHLMAERFERPKSYSVFFIRSSNQYRKIFNRKRYS